MEVPSGLLLIYLLICVLAVEINVKVVVYIHYCLLRICTLASAYTLICVKSALPGLISENV
jgi:hypothetical protein